MIVGCGGAGKTVLANQLSAVVGLPVVHLDGLYYDDRFRPVPAPGFLALQDAAIAEPAWIMDGNYASTMPRRLPAADTVIFLDLAWWTCLWSIVRRRWHYHGGRHDDGVHDRVSLGFCWYVVGYRCRMAPRVRGLIGEHAPQATVVTLRSRRQVDEWLARVAASDAAP
jgi:hypothetical protein